MAQRRPNGEGSMSTKPDAKGFYHCYMQTTALNENGNYIRVHGKGRTQEEASKDAKQKKAKVERDKIIDVDKNFSKRKTFGSYMNDFMQFKRDTKDKDWAIAQSTYAQYMNELKSCFHSHKISKYQPNSLNISDFKEYYKYLDDKYPNNPHRPKEVRGFCIKCLEWLNTKGFSLNVEIASIPQTNARKLDNISEEAVEEFKMMMFKGEEEKQCFTEEEINAFVQMHEDRFTKYTGAWLLQMSTGLRSQELFAIMPEIDLDRERRILYIYKAVGRRLINDEKTSREPYLKCCKNADKRIIILDDYALQYFDYVWEQTKRNAKVNPHNLLMCDWNSGNYIRLDNYNDSLDRAAKKYGIQLPARKKSHLFRKTWSTYNSLRAGISPILVAKGTGHKDTDVLFNTYIKPTIAQLSTLQSPFRILEDKYKKAQELTSADDFQNANDLEDED